MKTSKMQRSRGAEEQGRTLSPPPHLPYSPLNKKRVRGLIFLSLLALLSACVGTRSLQAPTLLVIGYEEAGQGVVALVRDTFLTEEAVQGRFLFVDDSERALPDGQAPVAYDVSDRNNLRNRLVVLSRAGTTGVGAISTFDLVGINPNAPSGFEQLRTLALSDLDVSPVSAIPLEYCPAGVQTSNSGRFVALLNDASLCPGSLAPDGIDIIDLTSASTPQLVRRVEASNLFPTFYLDQDDGDDGRLYYFTSESGFPRLRAIDLPSLIVSNSGLNLPGETRNKDVLDIQKIAGQLIVLQADQFIAVDDFASASPRAEAVVTTSSSSRKLVPTNASSVPQVMVIGSSRFTVHDSSTDDEEGDASVSFTDGSLEPRSGFVYFVRDSGDNLALFDLREYDPALDEVSDDLGLSFNIEEIGTPVFVTWAQSRLPAVETTP